MHVFPITCHFRCPGFGLCRAEVCGTWEIRSAFSLHFRYLSNRVHSHRHVSKIEGVHPPLLPSFQSLSFTFLRDPPLEWGPRNALPDLQTVSRAFWSENRPKINEQFKNNLNADVANFNTMTRIHQLCSWEANYKSEGVDQNCGVSDTRTWIFGVSGHPQ